VILGSYEEEEVLDLATEAQVAIEATVGREYFLYRREDKSCFVSIVEPKYWGERFQLEFLAVIKYGSDQTWSITGLYSK
jgi:hypothetical protein